MSSPSSSNAIRSIASLTRRNPPKSQLGPVNSGISALSCAASAKPLGTNAPFGKQFVENGKDLCRIANSPHREVLVGRRHLTIGAPQIAVARQRALDRPRPRLDPGQAKIPDAVLSLQQGTEYELSGPAIHTPELQSSTYPVLR